MLGHLGRLVEMQEQGVGNPPAQETPFGLLEPPLGTARLKAVELVATLLRLGNLSAEQGTRPPGGLGPRASCWGSARAGGAGGHAAEPGQPVRGAGRAPSR